MKNRRRFPREQSDARVEMSHPSIGRMTVSAVNISDGGIAVRMGHHAVPPVGTELQVRIKRHTGVLNDEPVPMQVVHVQPDGIVGLAFVTR